MTDVDPYVAPASEVISGEPAESVNPHVLWKQVTGVVIASIITLVVIGIFLILTAVFIFVDAWQAGIYKDRNKNTFTNLSPMGWAIGTELLFIVVFPVYLFNRNKLKTKKGNPVFFELALIFGVLNIFVSAIRIYLALH